MDLKVAVLILAPTTQTMPLILSTRTATKLMMGQAEPDIPLFYSPGTFEFEDEEALAFELGLKARIADRAEVNIAYFYTDITNLQLSVFDGGVGFNVSNAGLAVTQGVEIESRISLTEHWFMNASLAWMQFEYKDYKDGLCTSADILAINDEDDLTQPLNCKEIESFVPGSTTPLYTPASRPYWRNQSICGQLFWLRVASI